MKLRILLINPWIYDFAAVNLWSRPLGLLKVAEYLGRFDIELSLLDCLDIHKTSECGRGKYPKETVVKPDCLRSVPRKFGRYGISVDNFKEALTNSPAFDLVFVTSAMSYWYPGVQTAIGIIREAAGNIPVILGGTYATLWHGHASAISGADFIYKGQIDEGIKFVFNTFGFRVKNKRGAVPYYKLGLYKDYPYAPILTSTGCPYHCSYCGSGFLGDGFLQLDTEKVLAEIRELFAMGVRDFVFYDDALLVNPDSHIKLILKEINKNGITIRFHCPNGLHARFIDDELALLMKNSGFKTIRLSLETVDRERQGQTGGKVTSEEFSRAVYALRRHGFTKEDVGAYLMYGLPKQGLDEVKDGIAFLKSLNVRINLAEFSPIPGTGCWGELIRQGVISSDIDPLLTNNSVFSFLYSGYDRAELAKMKLEVKEYNAS